MTAVYVTAGVLAAWVLWWWFVGRNVPRLPPLSVDEDDPRMLAAMEQARNSLDRFRQLVDRGDPQDPGEVQAQVKVGFVSSSGTTEHLWAEVLELGESGVSVRYLTPPVTHTGQLERLHEHSLEDVEDWAVFTEAGRIHGGYTQRAMFAIARETHGDLPPELAEQEARYVPPAESA